MEYVISELKDKILSEKDLSEYIKNNQDKNIPYFKYESELFGLFNFYNSDENFVCEISGPAGTFKTKLAQTSFKFLSDETLVFNFLCFEATTLDDLFLSFFEDLKRFYQEHRISFSKIETNSLSKKINLYLSHLNKPSVILIDAYENLSADSRNKEEITNFLEHLNTLNKFKILIISKENETAFNDDTSKIALKPFDEREVKKYFESLKITAEDADIKQLYAITNGNTSYVSVCANIVLTLKTTLKSLLEDFNSKNITFESYILQKLTAFIPETLKTSIALLSFIKIGLTEEYLCESGLFTKEQINYLTEKGVLSRENGYVFIKEYLKKYLSESVSHFEKIKLHELLKNFYESQLPLKPSQRIMPLSRNTMRSQIIYHDSFLPALKSENKPDMTYMGYTSSNLTEWTLADRPTDGKRELPKKPESLIRREKEQEKKEAEYKEKYALTPEELALLGLPVDISKGEESQINPAHIEERKLLLSEILKEAQNYEDEHQYNEALDIYKNALSKTDDGQYEKFLPDILQKCIVCCEKLNNTDEAVKYLEQLYNYFYEKNDTENANIQLLQMAKTYKNSYRFLKAKEIYERFINSKLPLSKNILTRSYLGLAEIAEDSSNLNEAIENYKKAFETSDSIANKEFLAEPYFKYALILDDSGKTDEALEFYKKSVIENPDIKTNSYLSSAYTNIAEIFKERKDLKEAFKNYTSALKYDSELLNNEGIYYLCKKLAEISITVKKELVLNFLLKALSSAKRLQDNFYIADSYIAVGDYYNEAQNYEKALKAYLFAKNFLSLQDTDNEEIRKTEQKINNLKTRLDIRTFSNIAEGFKNNAV